MNIQRATTKDYETLICIWEDSVRTTHHFLSGQDIAFYREQILHTYFPAVELYIVRTPQGDIAGFLGLSDDMIEMLFIRSSEQGKGYGSRLIDFAIKEKHRRLIDVNEQNETASRFYLRKGFRIIGRDDLDPSGNPYPILHMEMPEPSSTSPNTQSSHEKEI